MSVVESIPGDETIPSGRGEDTIDATGGDNSYGLMVGRRGIDTQEGNDQISGVAGMDAIGLYNGGTISVGLGDDRISGTVSWGVGLLNFGTIEGGAGNDTITGAVTGLATGALLERKSPMAEAYGIQNVGLISGGQGDDLIIGRGVDEGAGIYNTGTIRGDRGNDTVDAFDGGFGGDGFVDMGAGSDTVRGFGSGRFDGGQGEDTLVFPQGTYTIAAERNGEGYLAIFLAGSSQEPMLVRGFELLEGASSTSLAPGSRFTLP